MVEGRYQWDGEDKWVEIRLYETLQDMLRILASILWVTGKPLEDFNHRGDYSVLYFYFFIFIC